MSTEGRTPLWLLTWTLVISLLTLLAVSLGLPEPESEPTFVQARLDVDRQSITVDLPTRLTPSNTTTVSRLRLHWHNTAKLENPALYASSLFHLHEIRVNGLVQKDALRYDHLLSDTSRPLLLRLPTNSRDVTVEIALRGSAVVGGYLSPVWVGEYDEMRDHYDKQRMLTVSFRQFMNYWLMLLAIIMALLWALRRQEISYGLFALIAAWQVTSNLTLIMDNSLLPTEWFRIGYLADFWQSVMLVPFAYSFTRFKPPLSTAVFFTLCLIASLISATIPTQLFLTIEQYLLIPISCVHLFWGIALFSRSAWRGDHQSALVLITLVMATAFALHDILIIVGIVQSRSNYLLIYAFLPVLSTICLILVHQFVRSQTQIDNMLATLKQRLRDRERQLQDAFAREQKIQHQRTITDERQRIIADMHDGLGGQLMSIIASANSARVDSEAISHQARQALTDLRLMILSLDNAYQDLLGLLAAFRDRAESQCDSFGVDLVWEAHGLPEIDTLSPQASANLLRITQEALQNALRHSGADTITLEASGNDKGGVSITLRDNGRGGVSCTDAGRGMHTMQRRAVSIGAELQIRSDESGTEVSLEVPRIALQGSA